MHSSCSVRSRAGALLGAEVIAGSAVTSTLPGVPRELMTAYYPPALAEGKP
jgi:hypothetical protein